MHIWVRKDFFHYSHPTITGSCSTIQVVDFGSVVSPIRIFQKCTKWLIGTLKRLFWPQKNFSNYVPLTIVIVALPTIVSWKWFFSKIHQMAYRYSKTLIWAQKKFCNYGRPTTVIVDLPTWWVKNDFFKNSPNDLLVPLNAYLGLKKILQL